MTRGREHDMMCYTVLYSGIYNMMHIDAPPLKEHPRHPHLEPSMQTVGNGFERARCDFLCRVFLRLLPQ